MVNDGGPGSERERKSDLYLRPHLIRIGVTEAGFRIFPLKPSKPASAEVHKTGFILWVLTPVATSPLHLLADLGQQISMSSAGFLSFFPRP